MHESNDLSLSGHSRRNALRLGALAIAGASTMGTVVVKAVTATPSETQGPFWVDELLNRSDIRTDPANNNAVQAGFPLYLSVNVARLANGRATPVSGAYIDIWHANALGAYSDVSGSGNPNNVGQKWLRGYQITNARGIVNFTTIYPGWYVSRTAHIHARVRTYSAGTLTLNFTTQFFFDDAISDDVYQANAPYNTRTGTRDTRNTNDSVYNTVSTGSTAANPDGTRLLLRLADDNTFAEASFNIVIV